MWTMMIGIGGGTGAGNSLADEGSAVLGVQVAAVVAVAGLRAEAAGEAAGLGRAAGLVFLDDAGCFSALNTLFR